MKAIQSFNKALKTMWLIKYLNESNLDKLKLFFDNELQNYGGIAVFKGNLVKEDLSKIKGLSDVFIMVSNFCMAYQTALQT